MGADRQPIPIRDDEAYSTRLKELLANYPQSGHFDMQPYREANEFACATRFSMVATQCLVGNWLPLMEWCVEIAKSEGVAEAVSHWFKVTSIVKKEWAYRKETYGNPYGPKRPWLGE